MISHHSDLGGSGKNRPGDNEKQLRDMTVSVVQADRGRGKYETETKRKLLTEGSCDRHRFIADMCLCRACYLPPNSVQDEPLLSGPLSSFCRIPLLFLLMLKSITHLSNFSNRFDPQTRTERDKHKWYHVL